MTEAAAESPPHSPQNEKTAGKRQGLLLKILKKFLIIELYNIDRKKI
jgi:hypothetical protein